MGTASSHTLLLDWQARQFGTVVSHSDPHLGKFTLLRFVSESKTLYLLEEFDPRGLDQFPTDLQEFLSRLVKKHKNVCEFCFVTQRGQGELYDAVCEYGDPVFPNFHSEKLLWGFLSNILNGLLFLHSIGLHYPSIHKRYTVFFSSLNCFKLVNPFCFPEFVSQVFGVLLNPSVQVSVKKKLFSDSLMRNLREIGVMILSILFNVEDFSTAGFSPSSLASELRGKVTDHLIDFVIFALENREVPVQLPQVATFFSSCFSAAKAAGCQSIVLPLSNPRARVASGPSPWMPENPSTKLASVSPLKQRFQVNNPKPPLQEIKNLPNASTSHHGSVTSISSIKTPKPGQKCRFIRMGFAGFNDEVLFSADSRVSSRFENHRRLVNEFRLQKPTVYHLVEEDCFNHPAVPPAVVLPPRIPTARELFSFN